jgi:hypothetical protein
MVKIPTVNHIYMWTSSSYYVSRGCERETAKEYISVIQEGLDPQNVSICCPNLI